MKEVYRKLIITAAITVLGTASVFITYRTVQGLSEDIEYQQAFGR